MVNKNIIDIIDTIGVDDLDKVIELLKDKKRIHTAGDGFKQVFNSGHIIEIQYDKNCLVYVDRLINVNVAGNTASYTFGMFGTDGKITVTLSSKIDEHGFNFTSSLPYVQVLDSLVFDNSNYKTTHLANALVVCKLMRGVYDKNMLVPVENDALRCLTETRNKVQEAVNKGIADPISQPNADEAVPTPRTDMRIFTPRCLNENSENTNREVGEKLEEAEEAERVEKSSIALSLETVINDISTWLTTTSDSSKCSKRILVEIDTNKTTTEGNTTVTRRNNLSMAFKSLFIDSSNNTILFGIESADCIDSIDSKSWKYKINEDESFSFSWDARSGAFIIIGTRNNIEACKFKIRFMNSNGQFVEDVSEIFSDFTIKCVS